jgi:OTU domain-containing protein 6
VKVDFGQYEYWSLRGTAASFIKSNKEDFEPFLYADDYSSAKDIETYCKEIEETALWGGEMEITALARALGMRVEIYSNRSVTPMVILPNSVVKNEDKSDTDREVIRLAYYEHLYGLGQHYNSVFKVDTS